MAWFPIREAEMAALAGTLVHGLAEQPLGVDIRNPGTWLGAGALCCSEALLYGLCGRPLNLS